jgi:hypothetical protein
MVAAAGTDDVVLEITGPDDAKSIIADFFGGS